MQLVIAHESSQPIANYAENLKALRQQFRRCWHKCSDSDYYELLGDWYIMPDDLEKEVKGQMIRAIEELSA